MKSGEREAYLSGCGNIKDSSNNGSVAFLYFCFSFFCSAFFCFPVFFPPAPSSPSPLGSFLCSLYSLLQSAPQCLFVPSQAMTAVAAEKWSFWSCPRRNRERPLLFFTAVRYLPLFTCDLSVFFSSSLFSAGSFLLFSLLRPPALSHLLC